MGKPARARTLPRSPAWGRHSGAPGRGHPPPRVWVIELEVHARSPPACLSDQNTFLGVCPSRRARRPHAAEPPGVHREVGMVPAGLQPGWDLDPGG